MSIVKTLQTLGQELKQAAAAHDWAAVLKTDEYIAGQLALLKDVTLGEIERLALENVQDIHRQVLNYCQGQSEIVAEKMQLVLRNREGAVAYASLMNAGDIE